MTEKLTVVIPCRNERINIRACIEAALLVADEVLVADSLSDDDTLAIVRDMGGCRIIEREFINFSSFKNWAISQAVHSWVLLVDADERVTPKLADEIRRVLADPAVEVDGYWIRRRNFYFNGREVRHCGLNRDWAMRLLRRDRCRYRQSRVHEAIDLPEQRTARLRNRLIHYPYRDYRQFLRKFELYTRLVAEDRYDRGRRSRFLQLLLRGPLTFLKTYVLQRGFLDGQLGLQLSVMNGFYSFMKEARLWELEHAVPLPDEARQTEPSMRETPATTLRIPA